MRWKLLVITSLLSALAGAGSCLAATHFLFGAPASRVASPDWASASTFILPLAATTYASIFVYRRTSRRRALQAAATAILSLLLTLTVFITVSTFFRSPAPDPSKNSRGVD